MTSQNSARLVGHATYFPVADVDKSMNYYAQVLGFGSEYSAGSPMQFAICSRDGYSIMLRRVAAPELIVPNEKQGGTWDAFFWVNDADALHAQLQANGAEVVYGPLIQDAYNMREFAIRDCDGHVLGFGQPLS